MSKIRVGVVRGGLSGEHNVSLRTGASVLENLPKKYEAVDIVLDKYGTWYMRGEPKTPEHVLHRIDLVFNCLHGFYGEDGKFQRLLEMHHIPYTGSRVLGSVMAMNKKLAKEMYQKNGLKTPNWVSLRRDELSDSILRQIFQTFPQPSIIKPMEGGSSIGIVIARTFNEFKEAVEETLRTSRGVLVEEYIKGREGTCGILEDFRGEKLYGLPPVEIIPPQERTFFDYEVKYDGSTQEICPSNFEDDHKQEILDMAQRAHEALGLRHYSRSDFIISPRGIFILETNTLPGLTQESLLPKAVQSVGCSFPDFLDHLITQALVN